MPPPGDSWLFGRYRLETGSRRLWNGERARELDPRALAVLVCLLRRAGDVVPRGTLMAEAWPESGSVVDSAVSKVMRRLRLALDDPHGRVLQTIYGEGYRLALPVAAGPAAPGLDGASPGPRPAARTGPTAAAAPDTEPDRAGTDAPGSGQRPWLARLPWIIAAVASLAALVLAWLLAGGAAAA